MLTHLKLERFKNFRSADLTMGPLTVLVGTNAAGKSNIRDALRFLHGVGRGYSIAEIIGEKWGEGGVLQWKGIRGGTRETALNGETSFSIEVDFISQQKSGKYFIKIDIGTNKTAPRVLSEKLTINKDVIFDSDPHGDPIGSEPKEPHHITIRMRKGPKERGKWGQRLLCLDYKPILGQLADNKQVRLASNREAASFVIKELESMRFLDLEPEALRRPSIPGQTVLGDKGENLSSVLQALCENQESRDALASWVAELTPMDASDFEFPSDQTGKILVSLVEKGGGKISAYSASDGTLRFLAMVAALLGKDNSRFYFFEELDNGIHPARLHLLLELIERHARDGAIQMVVTTHSPDLLGQLSPESLRSASLVYRIPETNVGNIVRILDLPNAQEIINKQPLTRLHATGWLEDAVFFSNEDGDAENGVQR